jgi:hypothetical protein
MKPKASRFSKRNIFIGLVVVLCAYIFVQRKPAFEQLSAANKQFVVDQHRKALELYTHGEYEKALTEIRKISAITKNYADSREIEKYANLALTQRLPAGHGAPVFVNPYAKPAPLKWPMNWVAQLRDALP